ncbi:cytochrome c [Polynucleobacter sp. HIN8]|jgi:mono/diheme cytochrome c family protein|uniref:c-type cytochrome n=1 Tax=Polynucleobacter sp. HIN8 TaxID=3047867 RepID=UPI0025723EB0|nr:c-type cytochrome [Polynucleobacter sp. HIN8]BEI38606.1 cytochrome c [Polynucleobacter sp. HIN8]
MKIYQRLALGTASLLILVSVAHAQSGKVDFGKREYVSNCANCHGMDGKGNGPYSDLLKKSPPNLTTLSKNNGGIFPMDRLYQSITGDNIKAHGSRDMPIWGMEYRVEAANRYMESSYDPDAYVRVRVLALLEYLYRLQIK